MCEQDLSVVAPRRWVEWLKSSTLLVAIVGLDTLQGTLMVCTELHGTVLHCTAL